MNLLTVLLQAPAAGGGKYDVDHADSYVCYHVFLYDSPSK